SLGAKIINETVRKSLNSLLPKFDVVHICGKGNLDDKQKDSGYYQMEYLDDIEYAFAAADVCVTRGGANALNELLALKKPCVVVPLPKGESRGDQVYNARYFQKLGLVSVLEQNALTEKSLVNYVSQVYANRFNLSSNFEGNPVVDKSHEIAKLLHDFAI
ncbi:MAG: UDP-N-acetylglucosamine--N-acetylmuramyl-(pentapeptide) pyrophosphoryl-undecaprenol N-acetylglucosamine transferase, partial [Clostridiales bacterium]|nr:UDP-N-acetylglucosamine--N-acetylmuramyl-(pentapeptide) pyrophosphoryl-undecaprenol N-acetylglucosamine transferase [Clostridiales bacterium]